MKDFLKPAHPWRLRGKFLLKGIGWLLTSPWRLGWLAATSLWDWYYKERVDHGPPNHNEPWEIATGSSEVREFLNQRCMLCGIVNCFRPIDIFAVDDHLKPIYLVSCAGCRHKYGHHVVMGCYFSHDRWNLSVISVCETKKIRPEQRSAWENREWTVFGMPPVLNAVQPWADCTLDRLDSRRRSLIEEDNKRGWSPVMSLLCGMFIGFIVLAAYCWIYCFIQLNGQ